MRGMRVRTWGTSEETAGSDVRSQVTMWDWRPRERILSCVVRLVVSRFFGGQRGFLRGSFGGQDEVGLGDSDG